MKIKVGAKKDGTITAGQAEYKFQAGAYPGSPVQLACMCGFTPYDIANVESVGFDIVVNRPKATIRLHRLINIDSELVLLAPGGDLFMRLGVNIGIDADGNLRGPFPGRGDCAQRRHLGKRFDIDLHNAGVKRFRQFVLCLADAGEDDPIRRNTRDKRFL